MIDSFTGATERHIEVGDGLEIFFVLAKDSNSLQSLQTYGGIQEVTINADRI